MAYLNCPFCPSQGVPLVLDGDSVEYDILGYGPVVKFRCNGGKHEFYVNTEDINGERQVDQSDVVGYGHTSRCVE